MPTPAWADVKMAKLDSIKINFRATMRFPPCLQECEAYKSFPVKPIQVNIRVNRRIGGSASF